MKSNVKKIASVLLAAVMLFSMCAMFSVSAAETSEEAVGAGLAIVGKSNYCASTVSPASAAIGNVVTVTYAAPVDMNLVSVQWGLNYSKSKLQFIDCTCPLECMVNNDATSYTLLGSASNDAAPAAVKSGDALFTFRFKVLGEGSTNMVFTVIDLMSRTSSGDKLLVNNCIRRGISSQLTVQATSNVFAGQSTVFEDVTEFEDEHGDMYVTVAYKMCAEDLYLVNIDIDELTYDPLTLEWKEEYNTFGEGRNAVVDLFPFAAENGLDAGTVHLVSAGRLVGNYSSVKPAAYASEEDGSPVTVVKATFKVINPNVGTTTVNCNVKTLCYCDIIERNPYMQFVCVDKKVVNESIKSKATYTTTITSAEVEPAEFLLGDVDNNGRVEINDITMLQRYLAEFIDAINTKAADVNKDGYVNVKDVTEIQRYLADLITSFD